MPFETSSFVGVGVRACGAHPPCRRSACMQEDRRESCILDHRDRERPPPRSSRANHACSCSCCKVRSTRRRSAIDRPSIDALALLGSLRFAWSQREGGPPQRREPSVEQSGSPTATAASPLHARPQAGSRRRASVPPNCAAERVGALARQARMFAGRTRPEFADLARVASSAGESAHCADRHSERRRLSACGWARTEGPWS